MKNSFITSIKMSAVMVSALGLASSAFADGLSGTLVAPLTPNFGIEGTVNYNIESPTGLVSGGSIVASGDSNGFGLKARVGTKYAVELYQDFDYTVVGYVGVGANAILVPSPMGVSVDASAGLKTRYFLSPMTRIYGDADFLAQYDFSSQTINPFLVGTVGAKFNITPFTDVYAQTSLATGFGATPVGFDLRLGSQYNLDPQWKVGGTVGYGNFIEGSNGLIGGSTIGSTGFSARVGLQYVERDGSIGTPGAFLP